jgi:hypothetical protein
MKAKRSILSALVLVSLITLSSVVSLRLSFEIPGSGYGIMLDTCGVQDFYRSEADAKTQNKIAFNLSDKVITRDPIIRYLAKQGNSPPE